MSKIEKLIAKALNNSNAQEAASALKMATSHMLKDGVNPSDILQIKNKLNDSDTRGRCEELISELTILNEENHKLKNEIKYLKSKVNNSTKVTREELTEAKKVAISWAKKAKYLEAELNLALETIEKINLGIKEKKQRKREIIPIIVIVTCVIIFFVLKISS